MTATNQTPPLNRLKLYYVDNIPIDIESKRIVDLLDSFDCDVIKNILEKNEFTDTTLIYTQPDLNTEYVYIENAYEVTYPHALLLLNKFPKAEVIMFLTNDSLKPLVPSIIDTHFHILNVEDLRTIKPPTSKKRKLDISYIDAKQILDQYKTEIENYELWRT